MSYFDDMEDWRYRPPRRWYQRGKFHKQTGSAGDRVVNTLCGVVVPIDRGRTKTKKVTCKACLKKLAEADEK